MPDFQLLPVPGDPFKGQEPGADPEMQAENARLSAAEGSGLLAQSLAWSRAQGPYTPEPSLADQAAATARSLRESAPERPTDESFGASLEDQIRELVNRPADRPLEVSRSEPQTLGALREMYAPQASHALQSPNDLSSAASRVEAQIRGNYPGPLADAIIRGRQANPPAGDLSDEAIERALRENPGASIFDVANRTPLPAVPRYRSDLQVGRDLYDKHIAPQYGPNMDDFVKDVFAGMASKNPEQTKVTGDTNGTLSFSTVLRDEKGNALGTVARTFDPNTGEVHHDLFSLNRSAQGSDIAKKVLASQMSAYQKMGNVNEVTLSANIDVGGYAWAKYGFYPTQDSWNMVRRNATTTLQRMVGHGEIAQEDAEPVFRLLENRDPKTIWDISDLKQPVDTTFGGRKYSSTQTTLGKALLLNRAWSGRLPLDDTQAMERFNAYTGRTTQPGSVQPGQPGQPQRLAPARANPRRRAAGG